MKKLLSLILALAMLMSLAACSSSSGTTQSAQEETTTEVATETEEVAEEQAEEEAEAEVVEVDPVTIEFSTTYQQTETAGQLIAYFVEELSQLSGGNITVNVSWGGTLFDNSSQLSAVSEGAVDMIAYMCSGHESETPLLASVPSYAPGDNESVVEYYNYLLFENEETSAVITAEASALGIKYLNVLAGGPDAFCTTFDFDTLEELVARSSAFGIMASGPYAALGLNCTAVSIAERYDGLDRGIIDATTMTLSAISSMSWYEVAPYVMINGLYSAGNFFTVNESFWDGLSQAQQELIQQAADLTEEYSIQLINGDIDSATANIEANGGSVKALSDEDVAYWWSIFFTNKYQDGMDRAALLDIESEMTTVFQAAADFTGCELP